MQQLAALRKCFVSTKFTTKNEPLRISSFVVRNLFLRAKSISYFVFRTAFSRRKTSLRNGLRWNIHQLSINHHTTAAPNSSPFVNASCCGGSSLNGGCVSWTSPSVISRCNETSWNFFFWITMLVLHNLGYVMAWRYPSLLSHFC